MAAAGVPTARQLDVARAPCVLKADGLAAGKGVVVCRTDAELDAGLRSLAGHGELLVEELLEGVEVSLFALCDGRDAVPLPPARDFKRAFDGDEGPNTGGMGSYAPVTGLGEAEVEELVQLVHRPVLAELARRGAPFVGLLYAGLMLTGDGPRVLEFNCRFGDPETQSVLPLVEGDLLAALAAAAAGELGGTPIRQSSGAAVTIVLAAAGYPRDRRPRDADHGCRVGRGGGRARVPLGHGAPGRSTADERGPHPRRDGSRPGRCGRENRGVCSGRAGLVYRRTAAGGHRAADGRRQQLTPENAATSGISPGHPSPPPAFEPTVGTHTCQCHGGRRMSCRSLSRSRLYNRDR